MANTILTSTVITREALRILHQKLNFISGINRQYDSQFAVAGARIGSTMNIRLPNKYVVRSGANLSAQDTTETNTTLTVNNQKGVDLNFTSVDLTMSLDDFSQRILAPAMAVLAANIEADAFSMFSDIYQIVGTPGTTPNSLLTYLQANARLDNSLAPMDRRRMIIDPIAQVTLVDALKGLFNNQSTLAKQYTEGNLGRTGGFDFFTNTLVPSHTLGTQVAASMTVNGAAQVGSTISFNVTNAATLKKGTVFTIAGVFEVHPETKAITNRLQNFVVAADVTAGSTTANVTISPAIVIAGSQQNVSASPANTAAVTFYGSAAPSTIYQQAIGFHPDAFTFATADLVMPGGVDFASRQVQDGISMRIVRAYDINADKLPCRLDVLYGYKTIRPELAVRVTS